MAVETQPQFYTVEEVAQLLRCHTKTIRRRISRRELLATKPPGSGAYLIPRDAINEYLSKGGNK